MVRPRMGFDLDEGSFSDFVRTLAEEEGVEIEAILNRMGQEMVDEAISIVRAELPTTEHKLNQTHLDNSFRYLVNRGPGPGGEPWELDLTIKPGVSSGKIWALNYGTSGTTKQYVIRPRNVPRALEFSGPGTDYGFAQQKGKYAGRVLKPFAVRTVTSGPREGTFFLERARDTVMGRYGFA